LSAKTIMEIPFQAVLFDLDGVLVDACDWHYESLNRALQQTVGYSISREDHLLKYNGLPTKVKLKMLEIDDGLAQKINDLKQSLTIEVIEENAIIMAEKIELLSYLKSIGVKTACVTNSIKKTASMMLSKTGQLEYLDAVISNEDVAKNKPNPDCYNLAISVLNVDPKFVLCVEDSITGITAALNSSAKYLWKVSDTTEVTLEGYRRFCNEDFDTHGGRGK
jgi:beta-phosphoglucomutase